MMEPADIDWKNIDSRFIRDELYEHINAPKWLDLSAPDSPLDAAAAAAAWFCRPDCRHPETFEDFRRPSPSPKPTRLNAQSLKRRGGVMSVLLPPPSPAKGPESGGKGKGKKFREDSENQDPNGDAAGRVKAAPKEAMKSSAEKKQVADEERRKVPRLRSTMSAANLFSGRDVLGQISEFCQEIKRLAVGREKSSAAKAKEEVRKEVEVEEERKVLVDKSNLKENDGPAKSSNEKFSVLKEVRACPPTPQRIPSPSNRRPRKAGTNPAISPLSKPLKSKERGILKELDQRKEEEEEKPLVSKDEERNRATGVGHEGGEGSSMDMFWFFKPCTYLVK